MSEPQDFADRVALITGGTQGLGLAVAQLLRLRGARGLVLVGRDVAKGEAAAAGLTDTRCRAVFVEADLEQASACEAAVAAVDDQFGTCHSLINCAARTDRGTVWNTSAELWDRMLAVNVRAPALLGQGVARVMAREGVDGTIVFIGSVAHHGGAPNLLAYSTSKMALVAMTRSMAYQLMRHRIRVNLLNPGWMDTPGEDKTQRLSEGASDGWLERAEREQPWGRLVKPEEIAKTIVHLASPESGMMSGVSIDWDQTVAGAGPEARPAVELGVLPEDLKRSDRTEGKPE